MFPGRGSVSRRSFLAAGGTIAGAALLSAAPARASQPAATTADLGWFAESTIWASGEDGRVTHFVYGLAVTPKDTVLAFSEARISKADAGAHDLVCKRSTDGGNSWSDTITIERSDGTQSWTNPAALVDRSSGAALIFYALNSGNESTRVFVRTSPDDGRTWSDRIELTALFDGNPQEWTVHMPGPGHGIQLRDGRLVLQLWHRRGISFPVDERRYGVSVIVSDDHGATWRDGGTIPVDPVYPVNESRLVERADGSLVMNGRYSSGGVHPRIAAVSTDRGETWSAPIFDSSVELYTAVDSSFTRFVSPPGLSRTLFSRPDSATARQNLVVSVSYDYGCSYPYGRVVYAGPASYSDIAHLADGTILVLYGKDLNAANTVDHVVLARFDLAWLTSGQDSLPGRPPLEEFRYQGESLRVVDGDVAVVADPNASGYQLLEHVGAAPFELSVPVPRAGTYDLAVRCRQTGDSGSTQVWLDGRPVGVAFTPVLDPGVGFVEFPCGSVTLTNAGPHVLRFATAPGPGGGQRLDLDYVRFTAGSGG